MNAYERKPTKFKPGDIVIDRFTSYVYKHPGDPFTKDFEIADTFGHGLPISGEMIENSMHHEVLTVRSVEWQKGYNDYCYFMWPDNHGSSWYYLESWLDFPKPVAEIQDHTLLKLLKKED